jgi:hypothetical protein
LKEIFMGGWYCIVPQQGTALVKELWVLIFKISETIASDMQIAQERKESKP